MRKRLILLAVCLLFMVMLFGCGWFGGGAESSKEATESNSVEQSAEAAEKTAIPAAATSTVSATNTDAHSDSNMATGTDEQKPAAEPNETSSHGDAEFDRYTMMANILTYAVLPANERFAQSTVELKETLRSLDAEPSLETLMVAQSAWRAASNAWAECDMFGSRELALIHNQIDKWPANINFMEDFIANTDGQAGSLDVEFVASVGSTSKGLPAMEYLLFGVPHSLDAASEEAVLQQLLNGEEGARRRHYLVGMGDHLNEMAAEVNSYWLGEPSNGGYVGLASQFFETAPASADTQSMLSLIMNGVSEQLEDNLQRRLWGVVQQELGMVVEVESPYAHHSIEKLRHSIVAFQRTYAGGLAADDLGLDDYLDYLDVTYSADIMSAHVQTPTPDEIGTPLSVLVTDRANALLAMLEQIETPLAQAIVEEPELLAAINAAAHRLLLPVRVDMNNQFGVTLSFNDGD